jgi:tRNA1(Val) A37 N6-methylase TrmN6
MTGTDADMPTDEWHGAYEGGWQGLIVPEAFSHPAKFSYSLTERMFGHAYAKEWVKKGDVVADPFGGVGCGGIVAAYCDLQWVGCELEQKFVDLAEQNFELHRRKWEKLNSPMPQIIQGDSRKLAAKLGTVECVVSSPPFIDDLAKVSRRGIGSAEYGHGIMKREVRLAWANLDHEAFATYLKGQRIALGMSKAEVDRQIGTNTAYSFYEGRMGSQDQWRVPLPSTYRKLKKVLLLDNRFDDVLLNTTIIEYERQAMKMGHTDIAYGQTPGQLGAMKPGSVDAVVASPPFQGSQPQQDKGFSAPHDSTRNLQDSQYATSPGNLGNLKPGDVDCVVSSPPYVSGGHHADQTGAWGGQAQSVPKELAGYGQTPGQLGSLSAGDLDAVMKVQLTEARSQQTFWQAAKEIVQQCHQILKPGGHAIWVVKAFVRKGKIVDFPGDWRRLCESVGFETVCVHHAMLVKETKHKGLFGEITEIKSWKSFFRRLTESKGSPAVDFEVVLCMEKRPDGPV